MKGNGIHGGGSVGGNDDIVYRQVVFVNALAQVAETDGPGTCGHVDNFPGSVAVGHRQVLGAHHRHQDTLVVRGFSCFYLPVGVSFESTPFGGVHDQAENGQIVGNSRVDGHSGRVAAKLVPGPGEHQLVARSHRDLGEGEKPARIGGGHVTGANHHGQGTGKVAC